jgi:hypothetical protein
MTEQEYRAADALNYSSLKHILRSPAHYKYMRDNPIEPTKAMQFGTLVHMRILEPEKYEELVVAETIDRRTKLGKERAEEIEAKGFYLISPEESAKIENIHKAVMSNPDAARFVTNGEREQAFFWTDIETGLKCKARPDFVHQGKFIVDIKTSKDASPQAFARTAASLMYHFQAAFYLDGVSTATTQNYTDFVFIVVEPEPPFGVALYSLDLMAIDAGRVMYRRALNRIKDCEVDGLFPAYPAGLQTLSLPNWVTYAAQEALNAD